MRIILAGIFLELHLRADEQTKDLLKRVNEQKYTNNYIGSMVNLPCNNKAWRLCGAAIFSSIGILLTFATIISRRKLL